MHTHKDYSSSHPWYYKLGGKVLTPKQIRAEAEQEKRNGFADWDVPKLANLKEAIRIDRLQKLQAEIWAGLFGYDFPQYLKISRHLRDERIRGIDHSEICYTPTDIHLVHNHIYYAFVRLKLIRQALDNRVQGELF